MSELPDRVRARVLFLRGKLAHTGEQWNLAGRLLADRLRTEHDDLDDVTIALIVFELANYLAEMREQFGHIEFGGTPQEQMLLNELAMRFLCTAIELLEVELSDGSDVT